MRVLFCSRKDGLSIMHGCRQEYWKTAVCQVQEYRADEVYQVQRNLRSQVQALWRQGHCALYSEELLRQLSLIEELYSLLGYGHRSLRRQVQTLPLQHVSGLQFSFTQGK